MLNPKMVAMIDGGFLTKAGCATLGIKPQEMTLTPSLIASWCLLSAKRTGSEFMRAYWYDSMQENPSHPDYATQKDRLNSLRIQSGIQVRLGSLAERPNLDWTEVRRALRKIGADPDEFKKHYPLEKKRYEQKGVDTLLVLDMVKLAQLNSYDTLLLVCGDTDIAEAVRTVQEYGKRVIIARPEKCGDASTLFDLADESVILTSHTLQHMLQGEPDFGEAVERIRLARSESNPTTAQGIGTETQSP